MGLTNFTNGITSLGNIVLGNVGFGNIYYVWQTSKTAIMADMLDKYSGSKYPDGAAILYRDDGSGDGILAAIAACKGGRSDYVIVGTGNYNLTDDLDLTGKSSVHLIGVNGGGCDVGTLGAAALTQTGNYPCVTMSPYSEVTGFQMINKNGYPAVAVPNNIWRNNIHHNYFHMVGGSAISLIDSSASEANVSGIIAYNKFTTWVGGVLHAAINVGYGTGISVIGNHIIASSTAMVLSYGIINESIGGITADNIVSEAGGNGVVTNGGTITVAIQISTSGTAIGNRCAVGTGQGLAGGTVSHTFVDNRDGQAGGATPIET